MTVSELIDRLKKCDPKAEVWTEGCDCNAPARGVEQDEAMVMILRNEVPFSEL